LFFYDKTNPLFAKILESIVIENELKSARDYGKNAENVKVSDEESDK